VTGVQTCALPILIGIISGAIVSIIAGSVTIFINLIIVARQQRNQITYEVISNAPALNEEVTSQVQRAFNYQMQVMFKKENWDQAQLISVKMKNTGTRPITENAYNSKIEFDFGNASSNAQVLAAEVLESEPPALRENIIYRSSGVIGVGSRKIVLDPLSLNKDDSITLQILVTDFKNIIENNTLLKGVKQRLMARLPGKVHIRNILFTFIFLTIVATVLFIFMFSFIFESVYNKPIFDNHLYNAFLISVCAGALTAAIIASIIHITCNYMPPLEVISDRQTFRMNKLRQPPSRTTVISTLSILPFVSGVFYFLTIYGLFTYIYNYIYTPEHIDSSLLEALNNSNLWGFVTTIILMIFISLAMSKYVHRRYPLKIPDNTLVS
jgi:hypothetical protein